MNSLSFKPATKKQLWALFCLTRQDYRSKNLSFQEASQLINQLTQSKNNELEHLKKSLIEAIQEGIKAYKKAYENEPTAVIYDAYLDNSPIPNGKKYIMNKFSGCGWAYIHVYNRKLINLFKRLLKGKKEGYIGKHYIEIGKAYRGGVNLYIDKKSYSNGNINCLVDFYEAIVGYLKNKGYEGLYCDSRLD